MTDDPDVRAKHKQHLHEITDDFSNPELDKLLQAARLIQHPLGVDKIEAWIFAIIPTRHHNTITVAAVHHLALTLHTHICTQLQFFEEHNN
jgi:hypothetical protein